MYTNIGQNWPRTFRGDGCEKLTNDDGRSRIGKPHFQEPSAHVSLKLHQR